MGYRSLRAAVDDLERTGRLVRIVGEVDPHLEAAAVHRRVTAAGGPAVLFSRVRGTPFPMVSNLFGDLERTRFLFRDALAGVRGLVRARVDPAALPTDPRALLGLPAAAVHLLPRRVATGPVLAGRTTLGSLPQLVSWPRDGGPFITLPQVYTEDPDAPGVRRSNLGMYRVQLAGNDYEPDREVGLHYQIHRGLGVHHAAAIARGERLPVRVFVGGPPAMTVAAVMPLPEGLPELSFAGALNNRAVRMVRGRPAVHADADFCLSGYVEARETKPEGPFGDHLGYYSLTHDFPVLHVTSVHHRPGAIWPFTVVGRPPQEDSVFGAFIHELTGPLVPDVLPGVSAVHAVDAVGVHPLLLAVGSERYVPYAAERVPMEVLTQASAILGQGQLSLAKYLLIAARDDDPDIDPHDVPAFLRHVLERVDPTRDLHFHTRTTIDTLDYSGTGLNAGSKLVLAAVGRPRRTLDDTVPQLRLPPGFRDVRVALPGILVLTAPPCTRRGDGVPGDLAEALDPADPQLAGFPLVVLVDDATAVRSLDDLLWITFTRSDPAADVDGVGAFTERKAWGCRGSIIIDARVKPGHAPALEPDPEVERRADRFFAAGAPLARWG